MSSYWHSYEVWQQKYFCEFDVLMVVTVSVLWCPVQPDWLATGLPQPAASRYSKRQRSFKFRRRLLGP
jgi:hypothetical protein